MAKFLDETGLSTLITKIQEADATKQDKLVSGTNIKTINNTSLLGSGNISISGGGGITEISTQYIRITDLAAGVYKLTYNGTKYLYYAGTSSTTSHTVTGGAGAVVLIVSKYSTTYWHWWYINGTAGYESIYYGYTTSSSGSVGTSKQLSSLYTGTPTDTKPNYLTHYNTTFKNTSSYSVYRYQILVFNGTGLSAFTSTSSSTGTSKTQLAAKYYPNSPIFYYGSTSTVSNNSTFTGSYIYQSNYSIDLRYSFNIGASALSTYSPVYIKMSINSDGTLSPVYSASSSGHPLTNTLPSSEDGYVYVYLGNSSGTNYYLDLEPVHPCFWYKNGKILPYGGGAGGMNNPMTTSGDIIYGGSSGTPTRLALGTANQVLKVNSAGTGIEWGTGGSGGAGVQDLTSNTAGTLDSTTWGTLKSSHSATIGSPTMTGLDSTYEFVNIKLSINSVNQFVKLSKNTTGKYSGLFFIEESTNLYEIAVYYNGTKLILRCATVY